MFVYEVMRTSVHTIHEDSPFEEILSEFLDKRISGAPVINHYEKLVGIISEKDLFSYLFPSEEEFYSDIEYWKNKSHLEEGATRITKMRARDMMRTNVITVAPSDSVMHACSLLLVNKIRRLPVVHGEKIVGIVTTGDLYQNFLKRLPHEQMSV